jgi:hypothetical protein
MDALKDLRKYTFNCWTILHHLLLRCWKSICGLLLRFWRTICEGTRQLVHGAKEEEQRVVIKTIELTAPRYFLARTMVVLQHCSVHIIPILATVTLTYLNLAGFFIGENLTGSTAIVAQNMDRLSLQVTAKIFVSVGDYCGA